MAVGKVHALFSLGTKLLNDSLPSLVQHLGALYRGGSHGLSGQNVYTNSIVDRNLQMLERNGDFTALSRLIFGRVNTVKMISIDSH